jgi:hypothetical protein
VAGRVREFDAVVSGMHPSTVEGLGEDSDDEVGAVLKAVAANHRQVVIGGGVPPPRPPPRSHVGPGALGAAVDSRDPRQLAEAVTMGAADDEGLVEGLRAARLKALTARTTALQRTRASLDKVGRDGCGASEAGPGPPWDGSWGPAVF